MVIFLMLPMEFKIKYKYEEGHSRLNITTSYLFGLFKPEIYPFDKEKSDRGYKTGPKDRIKSIQNDFQYKKFIGSVWNKIILEKINWETKIGFKDAYFVGIITGALWYFKSLLISLLLSKKEVKNLNYNIVSIYNKNLVDIRFDCIIKIRMVYIITVWIWIIKLNKGGEEIDRTPNRRVNENYNE